MSNPYDRIYKTRFAELGFTRLTPGDWRFVDMADPDNPRQIGGGYPSKEQLVASIESYAAEYGCDGANKPAALPLDASKLCMPVTRYKDAIFMPLPPELWRRIDSGPTGSGCDCNVCKVDGTGGYWDTLAVGKDAPKGANDFTYTIHYPALHPEPVRKANAYTRGKP